MIRYYRLFDLLNRRGMKLSDLRNILSSATVAKLRKGQYISGEAIEKICLYLSCQPSDIMEVLDNVAINEDFTEMYYNVKHDSYITETVTNSYKETKSEIELIDTDDPEADFYPDLIGSKREKININDVL